MVDQPNVDAPSPRAVTLARIWLLVLGCAWFLAGFFVGGTTGGWVTFVGDHRLVPVSVLHFAITGCARKRLAVFFSSFGP